MSDLGTGITVVFGTSGFTSEILGTDPFSATREPYETSDMSTTVAKTFAPSKLIDWGEASMRLAFDPDQEPPLDGAAETITITFPLPSGGLTAATVAGSGFFTGFNATADLEEKMTADATIKWTGDLTWTAST